MLSSDRARENEPPADPESVARSICLRLLTTRPRTRVELARALARRLVPAEAAESILDRLSVVGLIDDQAFAAAWVQSRHAGRGLAGRALARELRSRGVAADAVSEALSGLDVETERATARRLVDRRLSARQRETAGDARRLVGLLCRKGYPPGLAAQVVREALADSVAPDEIAALESLGDEGSALSLDPSDLRS